MDGDANMFCSPRHRRPIVVCSFRVMFCKLLSDSDSFSSFSLGRLGQ